MMMTLVIRPTRSSGALVRREGLVLRLNRLTFTVLLLQFKLTLGECIVLRSFAHLKVLAADVAQSIASA